MVGMDGVYAFGPSTHPIYKVKNAAALMHLDRWCCDEGHETPRAAAMHLAERMAAAWDEHFARKR